DYAVSTGTPWIYAAAVGSYGVSLPVLPGQACFRCLYPEPPGGSQPTCETAGVLNSITAAIASIQSADALQWLATGRLEARLTTLDVWRGGMRQIPLPEPDPNCPTCVRREFAYLDGDRRAPVS